MYCKKTAFLIIFLLQINFLKAQTQTPGTQKWVYKTTGGILCCPAIGEDGTVYCVTYGNNLHAIDNNGILKWSFETGHQVGSTPAIGAEGTIYFGSADHKLYAINPDGTEKWAFTTGDRIWSSPSIGLDGTIYVGSEDACFYAINPDGTQKWKLRMGADINSSPAIDLDGTIYVGSHDGKLYAINPDGTQKWAFVIGSRVRSSPAIGVDGTIYVGSDDYKLYAISSDGQERWSFKTNDDIMSSLAIDTDGTIYFGSTDNNLYSLNSDGTLKWIFNTDGWIDSSPLLDSEGTIYFGSSDNKIYAVNPNGSRKWTFNVQAMIRSSPTIDENGILYIGANDGNLYAIYTGSEGLSSTIWPKFKGNILNTGRKTRFEKDLGVSQIQIPDTVGIGSTNPLRITIYNYGKEPAISTPVSYQINEEIPITENYTGTIISGFSESYQFLNTWTPSLLGENTIKAYTSFAEDEDTTNDTHTKIIQVAYQNDIGISEIQVSSSIVINESVTIKVELTNNSIDNQSNFPISYQIDSENWITETYSDILAPQQKDVYSFSKIWTPTVLGDHHLTVKVGLSGDQNTNNDSIQKNITVEGSGPDIAVNPPLKNYGDIQVGALSSQTFTVTNEGTGDLNVSSVSILGNGDFNITSGGGAFTLVPGSTRDITVQFSPSSVGAKSDTLRLQSNDPEQNKLDVALSGSGIIIPIPNAEFTCSPTSGIKPLTVQFTNKSTGTISSYSWVFGDGGTSNQETPSHTYDLAGVYTVSLTVTGSSGSDTETKSDYIIVNNPVSYPDLTMGEWSGKSDIGQDVSFFVTSESTVEDFQIFGINKFWEKVKLYKKDNDWCFSFDDINDDSASGIFNVSEMQCSGYYYLPGMEMEWEASPIEYTYKNRLKLYFRNWYDTKKKSIYLNEYVTFPKLSENAEWLDNLFEWQCPGSQMGRAIVFDNYYLPYDITIDELAFNLNMAEASSAASQWVIFGLYIGGDSKVTELFSISGDQYKNYSETFKLDEPINCYKNEKVSIIISLLSPSIGPIGLRWGAGNQSYVEISTNLEHQAPISSFGADRTQGNKPLKVQFSDSSTGIINTWVWDFGDGEKSSEQNPLHTYYQAGTYTVSLSVSGPGGSDTKTKENHIGVLDSSSGIETDDQQPSIFTLYQNHPNPFNPVTTIQYALPKDCHVKLEIYDTLGKLVETLIDERKERGIHFFLWRPAILSTGIYFYKIQADAYADTKKLLFIK